MPTWEPHLHNPPLSGFPQVILDCVKLIIKPAVPPLSHVLSEFTTLCCLFTTRPVWCNRKGEALKVNSKTADQTSQVTYTKREKRPYNMNVDALELWKRPRSSSSSKVWCHLTLDMMGWWWFWGPQNRKALCMSNTCPIKHLSNGSRSMCYL